MCKVGSRFAALDPIAQGLERLYGSLDADVARGLALRMDHGSQYLSDHFLKQIRYWGIHPSFGFVEEPETNGVAERWNRTLKEQAIHGRIFQNLEAVRVAVEGTGCGTPGLRSGCGQISRLCGVVARLEPAHSRRLDALGPRR